jgi:CENP-B N-terminal DNA-binding domain
LAEKKQVIDGSGVGESKRKLGKRFDVDTTVIGKILKDKDGILNEYKQNINPDCKRSLHSTKHDELNEKVYELFTV